MVAYPYSEDNDKNTLLDILRQVALVSGAGLSAYKPPKGPHGSAPSPAPIGAMLTAGGLLLGQAQDKRRDRIVNSIGSQLQLGELNFDQAAQQLAESGQGSKNNFEKLRSIYQAQQEDKIKNPLMALISGERQGSDLSAPLVPGAQGPEPPLFMQRSAEGNAARLNKFFDEGGPAAYALYAMLNPTGANAAISLHNEQGAMKRAQMKAVIDAAKLAKEEDEQAKGAAFLKAYYDPTVKLADLSSLGAAYTQAGGKPKEVADLLNDRNKLQPKVAQALSIMGRSWVSLDPRDPADQALLEAAKKQVIREESDEYVKQRYRLINLAAEIEKRKILGDAALHYIDLNTGNSPSPLQSPYDLIRQGGRWVQMDPVGRRTVNAAVAGKGLLRRAQMYLLGGPADVEAARAMGVPVGTILPSVYAQAPKNAKEQSAYQQLLDGLQARIQQKVNITMESLAQTDMGRQAQLGLRAWNAYLTLIGKGVAGETHFTEGDAGRTSQGLPTTGLEGIFNLTDTEKLARALFETQFGILDEKIATSIGLNSFGNIPNIVQRAESGQLGYGAAPPIGSQTAPQGGQSTAPPIPGTQQGLATSPKTQADQPQTPLQRQMQEMQLLIEEFNKASQ